MRPQLIISIIGPESTGKTTLARQLSKRFDAPLVKEFARDFLTTLGRTYTQKDLDDIAIGQHTCEHQTLMSNAPVIVCDTDLQVIRMWSEVKYGSMSPQIAELVNNMPDRLYLLSRPDIRWDPDPLRESPNDREMLFDRYLHRMIELDARYIIVEGYGKDRWRNAVKGIEMIGVPI
jgi:NadR type nicotinamide-nucleotide adenylyltransferase